MSKFIGAFTKKSLKIIKNDHSHLLKMRTHIHSISDPIYVDVDLIMHQKNVEIETIDLSLMMMQECNEDYYFYIKRIDH